MKPSERLSRDLERVDRYRLAVSASGDYSVFQHEIRPDVWDYANRTLPKLIASGQVIGIRSRLGEPHFADLVMPPDGIDYDVAEDLAAGTIDKALPRFAEPVLRDWDGHRENPAVLGSYFINLPAWCSPVPSGSGSGR